MRNSHKLRSNTSGFTLLEMLLVLGILAAVTASAVVVIRPPSKGLVLTQESRSIAASLRNAQSRAVNSGTEHRFIINLVTRMFGIERENVAVKKRLAKGISIVVTSATGGTAEDDVARFDFFPDGSATGGTIRLKSGDRVARITVDWLTAAVRIERDAE